MLIPGLPSSSELLAMPPAQRVQATLDKMSTVQSVIRAKRRELDSLDAAAGDSDGLVSLTINADGSWKELAVSPEVTNELTNIELQDLINEILAAVNADAQEKWNQSLAALRQAAG